MSLIDCGINLLSSQFKSTQAVLESGLPEVSRFVLISAQLDDIPQNLALCSQFKGCITTAGVHPHHAAEELLRYQTQQHNPMDLIEELESYCQQAMVRAIGECGLDYYRNFSPPEIQRKIFTAQVELAVRLQLPLYLHERDALEDQLNILSQYRKNLPPLLVHCFTGGLEALQAYQKFDAYFSVAGWLCDPKRGHALRESLPYIDSDRLLIETDAPYLMPKELQKQTKGRVNMPSSLPYIAMEVAKLRGVPYEQLVHETRQNAERFFGPWPSQYG